MLFRSYFAYGNGSEFFYVALCAIPTCLLITGIMSNVKVADYLFGNKLMVWIGNISFELFLFHQLVMRYVHIVAKKLGFTPNCLTFIAIVLINVMLSCLWQYLYFKLRSDKINDKTV